MEVENNVNIRHDVELAGTIAKMNNSYSKYFTDNYEVSGSPKGYELEKMFQDPQSYIHDIIALSKYYYNKNGMIMRVINIIRDFGTGKPELDFPTKNRKVKKIIDDFNKKINLRAVLKDILFEKALTGNCAGYLRDFSRVDIFPLTKIDVAPIIVNNKPVLIYLIDTELLGTLEELPTELEKQLDKTYPKEVAKAIKNNKNKAVLDVDYTFFTKSNCSRYEKFGLPFVITAFDDLAHKTILKEAEKATATGIIEKILKVGVGDKDRGIKKGEVEFYDRLLANQKGSIRVTVPWFVNFEWIEPDTKIFGAEKFEQVDKDLLSALGVSLTLIRGEGGGSYAEGIINISGLIKTIESLREDLPHIVYEWYRLILEKKGENPDHAPTLRLPPVEIDRKARMEMIQFLFQNAGLPYQVLYKEAGYDYTTVKLMREEENKEGAEKIFKLREQPFQGQQKQEAGRPEKNLDERKTDKSKSNNNNPRPSKKK